MYRQTRRRLEALPSGVLTEAVSLFPNQYKAQVSALRDKIELRALAHRLNRPDVLQPPLAGLGAREAGARLLKAAAARGDWREVYALQEGLEDLHRGEGWGGPGAFFEPGAANRESAAVHEYLAGLNFEKAEMREEAIRCYKAVLRHVGGGAVPVAEAAGRLRVLTR